MNKAFVHAYIGNGKGKTTSAYGLAIRALGNDLKVTVVPFLKFQRSGEIEFIKRIGKNAEIIFSEKNFGFYFNLSEYEKQKVNSYINDLYDKAYSSLGKTDLIILDEILDANSLGIITDEQLKKIITDRKSTEVVMTGRSIPDNLEDYFDYVSEIRKIKHPFDKGQPARQGIEF